MKMTAARRVRLAAGLSADQVAKYLRVGRKRLLELERQGGYTFGQAEWLEAYFLKRGVSCSVADFPAKPLRAGKAPGGAVSGAGGRHIPRPRPSNTAAASEPPAQRGSDTR